MRDYSNLAYHSILDWRLGIDLARLALHATAAIDFSPVHWSKVPQVALQRLQAALPGTAVTSVAGLPSVVFGHARPLQLTLFGMCGRAWPPGPIGRSGSGRCSGALQ
jgi:hypothetical protein